MSPATPKVKKKKKGKTNLNMREALLKDIKKKNILCFMKMLIHDWKP